MPPTIPETEAYILRRWRELEEATDAKNEEGIDKARSSLAYLLAVLLNHYIDADNAVDWGEFGGDDLLDAEYNRPSALELRAGGLMCWGDQDQIVFLSPFVAMFQLTPSQSSFESYKLWFAADDPAGGRYTIPYTRDHRTRENLSWQKFTDEWGSVYERGKGQRRNGSP